jgi:ABC-type hemin transport system ATPase subunit
LLEFEALSLGVEGKRLLWVALAELRRSSLAEFDFEALEQRAVAQRQGIEEQRLAAARLVLG